MISSISNFLLEGITLLHLVAIKKQVTIHRGPKNVSIANDLYLDIDAHTNTRNDIGFINSAYRFVLRPSITADYTVHFADPDMYVWLVSMSTSTLTFARFP